MKLRIAGTTGLILAMGIALVACGSDDSDGAGGGSAGGPDAGNDVEQVETGTDAPGQDAEPDVDEPDAEQEAGVCTDVTSVSGTVVNESDAPYVGATATVCITRESGTAACLNPKTTDSTGTFSVTVPAGECLTEVAYQAGDPPNPNDPPPWDWSKPNVFCRVDISAGGDVTAPTAKLVSAPQCTRDPVGATSDPHTITAPDGAAMTIVPDDVFLFDFGYDDLRLLLWDDATWGWPCFINPSDPPDGLIALAPMLEVTSEDALHVSFPNGAGLTAGTVVDLYALGSGASMRWDGELVHEGHWEIIGEAVVSSDGARIETRPGEGLPFGTWVGWKQK